MLQNICIFSCVTVFSPTGGFPGARHDGRPVDAHSCCTVFRRVVVDKTSWDRGKAPVQTKGSHLYVRTCNDCWLHLCFIDYIIIIFNIRFNLFNIRQIVLKLII